MKKLLIVLMGILYNTLALASLMSYDQISPQKNLREVDLTYTNTIAGTQYNEQANLLRTNAWIKQNHLDKIGSTVHLTKEQLGIDVDVKVVAIKPTKLNYSNNNHENIRPITATFITHSNDVWDYTFKDRYGHTEIIQAVSAHPFYSKERQAFIPIGQFRIGEHVKTDNNSRMYLIGKQQNNTKPKKVYNFEVYQKHNYLVGYDNVLVHNMERSCMPKYPNEQAGEAAPIDIDEQIANEMEEFARRDPEFLGQVNEYLSVPIEPGIQVPAAARAGILYEEAPDNFILPSLPGSLPTRNLHDFKNILYAVKLDFELNPDFEYKGNFEYGPKLWGKSSGTKVTRGAAALTKYTLSIGSDPMDYFGFKNANMFAKSLGVQNTASRHQPGIWGDIWKLFNHML